MSSLLMADHLLSQLEAWSLDLRLACEVQALFRRAWELPEIRMAWDALTLEYGEL